MPRMHEGQVDVDADQVRRLLAEQFPQWADLPVTPVDAFGTDHALFHLGDDLVARMPIIDWAVEQAETDMAWLPVLAPQLPVELPTPVALGVPGAGFPYPWTVAPWIPGATPDGSNIDLSGLAVDLGGFVSALQRVDPCGGPVKTGTSRGVPLAGLDDDVRTAIDRLGDQIDGPRVLAGWKQAVDAPAWSADSVWIHGDLLPGNLLVRDRRLAAVIDFSGLGLGDPAPDIVPAWTIFEGESREVFRAATECDEATWRRSMGWALAPALTGLDYYLDSVPAFVVRSRRAIDSVLDELG